MQRDRQERLCGPKHLQGPGVDFFGQKDLYEEKRNRFDRGADGSRSKVTAQAYAALVWYPRPSAFLDMMTSAEYAAGNIDRENGTERHLILATHTTYSKLAVPLG